MYEHLKVPTKFRNRQHAVDTGERTMAARACTETLKWVLHVRGWGEARAHHDMLMGLNLVMGDDGEISSHSLG